MAQGQSPADAAPASFPLPLGQAMLRGRITGVRKNTGQRGGVFVQFAIPARDEWSSPQTVDVWAESPFAEVDEVRTIRVAVGGIGKSWTREVEHPQTGEVRKVTMRGADNTLTFLG